MSRRAASARASPQSEMVQLEVSREVLVRLLRDHRLVACELRCLNGRSRDLVWATIKDCLRMPRASTADFAKLNRSLL